jgi:tripartite-type tricarboxylate transporter receptor subunit TctC
MSRTFAVSVCCALSCVATSVQAQGTAAGYPSHAMRIFVPYTPGGSADVMLRTVAQHLTKTLGQAVVVENRPGASQQIALEAAVNSPADGHTLVMGTQSGLVLLTAARKALPYDPLKDFASISLLYEMPLYLMVNPSVPARSVQELIELARSEPGKLNYASIGRGSTHHLVMEMFKTMSNVDMMHVPFKGNAQAQTDLLAGQVQVMFEGGIVMVNYAKRGKLRALASTGRHRSQAMPELPTVGESGLPGFEMATWFGLTTRAGVARPIIDRLNHDVGELLRLPAMREKYAAMGIELVPSTPEEMAERIQSQIPVWSKVMRAAGIEQE